MELDTIYNMDCIEGMKMLPDKSIDLIVTDPPYLIKTISGGGTINKVMKLNQSLQDLTVIDITKGYDIEKFGKEFIRIMKEINIYFWCNKAQIPDYFNFYVKQHKCTFDILCWHKTNALPTYSNKYLSDTEYLLYFRKGKGKCFPNSYEDAKTYYIAPNNQKDKKAYGHPTIKPLEVMEKIIKNSSKEGQVIFDPFLGSGTTAVAAVNTNRHYIGFELEPKYFDIACNRLDDAERERERTIIFLFDDVKGGEIMAFWNILAGLLCFFGGFAACIGLIWLITNVVEKVSDYDEYDYYD